MNKNELVDKLLDYFVNEDKRLLKYERPTDYSEKRSFLRGIINMRPPLGIDEKILKMEDRLLQLELEDKFVTDVKDISCVEDSIALWLGDITTLKIGAIVNAANEYLLGCFIPNHSCIDNAIHTCAGIRLRLYCNEIMQGKTEKTGKAEITSAFNLPSDYVIHTVGPIVYGKLTDKQKKELAECYISCLNLAKKNDIRTIAFPSISTGVFHFPKDEASKIAINTVRDYLKKEPKAFDKIVFNVFTKEDMNYYEDILKN